MRTTIPVDKYQPIDDTQLVTIRAATPRDRHRRGSDKLIRQPGFRRLWFGQSISEFGSQVTTLALPLAAVLVLHASTFQVGLLTTAGYAAFLLVGLPAGAWVDRLRRRPIMIAADVIRAITLASVPAAYALHVLTLAQLYAVAFIVGVMSVFFDVAYMSYVPGLVGVDHVVEANAKLQVTVSLSQVGGPSAAGFLIGALGAPVAFLANAASFVVSVGSLAAIREREPAPVRADARSLRAEMAEGVGFVVHEPILRMIAACTSTWNLFNSAITAIVVVFLVRQVHLHAGTIGLIMSAGAVGGVIGGLSASLLRRRLGSARIIWVTGVVTAPFELLIPLTSPGPRVALFGVSLFVTSMGSVVYNVNQASFRQLLCPPKLLGRMNATIRFIVWGTIPIGGLLGGVLGSVLGDRDAIWVAAVGVTLAPVWLLVSPLLRLRDTPAPAAGWQQFDNRNDPVSLAG
jgi:MFS family permease